MIPPSLGATLDVIRHNGGKISCSVCFLPYRCTMFLRMSMKVGPTWGKYSLVPGSFYLLGMRTERIVGRIEIYKGETDEYEWVFHYVESFTPYEAKCFTGRGIELFKNVFEDFAKLNHKYDTYEREREERKIQEEINRLQKYLQTLNIKIPDSLKQ